jgi:hypothetical protein
MPLITTIAKPEKFTAAAIANSLARYVLGVRLADLSPHARTTFVDASQFALDELRAEGVIEE